MHKEGVILNSTPSGLLQYLLRKKLMLLLNLVLLK